jgi:hypothetical protein
VWWSPDSRYLVYSTGVSQPDRLVLTDREGKNQVSLIPFFSETGIVTSVVWSPDSRWFLVAAESITAYESPTRIFLFDRSGNRQLLVESYISAPPAWSPDGRSLALSLWMEPKTEESSFAIWLADLTDGNTAASLPASSVPRPQSTTTPVAVSPSLTPDQVVKNFWESIDQKEYRSAWSMLSERRRAEEQYPQFKAFYECMQQVSISSLQEDQKDEDTIIFSLKIDYQKNPDCNDRWQQPNEIYAILSKASSAAPWHIECISDKQTCLN